MTYHIRPARERDASQLFPLAREFATSFEPKADALESSLREILANEAAWLGVAEATDQLVGYVLGFEHCTFYANGRVSWVKELAVRSDWRGRGVGRALMRAFEGWATRRGAKLVALATRRAMPGADLPAWPAQRSTSSAWKRSGGGMVRPRASAVVSRVEDWRKAP